MKVSFSRAALAEAMGLVGSVVPSRTPKPVLRCVSLAATGKQVKISATNLELGLTYLIAQAQIEQEGEVVVEADRLSAVVRESADDVLVLSSQDSTCEITGADSQFTMYGQDPKQFPKIPEFGDEKADLEVALSVLQYGVAQTLFATAKESSRYAINGVLWEVKGKKLMLVATDGRRLARSRISIVSADEKITKEKIIVPAKTMALLEKIAAHDKEKVSVKLVNNQVLFSCGNIVVISNLVEGNFPKYEDIIPKDYDKKITINTEAAISAARRASLLTSEESKGIKLSISKDRMVFSGRSPEAGAAVVNMTVDYKGQEIEIGFNPTFLIEGLRVLQSDNFEMELGQSDRPGLIKSGLDFLYVLMPISLS